MNQEVSFEIKDSLISPLKRSQTTYDRLISEPVRARFLSNHYELLGSKKLDPHLPSHETLNESRYSMTYQPKWYHRAEIHKVILKVWGLNITRGFILFVIVTSLAYLLAEIVIWAISPTAKKEMKRAGFLASTAGFVVFTFATKNSLWAYLAGLSFDKAMIFHKTSAILMLILTLHHWYLATFRLSGFFLLGTMAISMFFALWLFRKHFFRVFYVIHVLSVFLIIGFAVWHKATVLAAGGALWLAELFFRIYVMFRLKGHCKQAKISIKSPQIVELSFPKHNLTPKAGQCMFIAIPEISVWEFHPFSITSSPMEEDIRIIVKINGDWTRSLLMLTKRKREVEFYADGPYGNLEIDLHDPKYKQFFLIAGGIGVTPILSIVNSLMEDFIAGRTIRQIKLIWASKSSQEIKALLDERNHLLQYLSVFYQEEEFLKDNSNRRLVDLQIFVTDQHSFHIEDSIPATVMRNLMIKKLNLSTAFFEMKELAKESGDPNVAVFCCGPENLMAGAIEYGKLCGFDVHCESFEL